MVQVEIGSPLISVTPDTPIIGSGPIGGPFLGADTYIITSERPTPVQIDVSASAFVLTVRRLPELMVTDLETGRLAGGIDEADIHWDERIYHAATGTLMDVLAESPADAQRVLIAGHNPGLESLVQTLCRHRVPMPDDWKLMPTAAVAHLAIPTSWPELDGGTAELLSLTRARSLAD